MRLGLAVFSAAVVIGGYALVNTIRSRPPDAPPAASAPSESLRSWLPGAIEEPETEVRSYELIRFMNKDGSFGMVDDPRRVPPGATILGRERKTAAVPTPAAAEPEPEPEPEEPLDGVPPPPQRAGRRLSPAEQRLVQKVLETGVFPDAHELEQMEGDLDELDRERAAEGLDVEGPDGSLP